MKLFVKTRQSITSRQETEATAEQVLGSSFIHSDRDNERREREKKEPLGD